MHFAGPALLFFDAFILRKAFSDFYRITTFAFFINFGYFGWLEIFVQPNSNFPVGKITAGRQMVEGKINLAGQVIQQTDDVWNYKSN